MAEFKCECDDKGYLIDQTTGTAEIPDNAVVVQACASCDVITQDEDAARAAYLDHGTSWGFSFDTRDDGDGHELPGFDPAEPWGEYWIVHVDDDEALSAFCVHERDITAQGGWWAHDNDGKPCTFAHV